MYSLNMTEIPTISLKRAMITHLLINPPDIKKMTEKDKEWRNNAPIEDGWLLPSDFPSKTKEKEDISMLKHYLKPYSKTELDRERKALKSMGIAEIKTIHNKTAKYKKHGKVSIPSKQVIRLKPDKETFLTLFKSFYNENKLNLFMGSYYYLTNPYRLKIFIEFMNEWDVGWLQAGFNDDKRYSPAEEIILAVPELFLAFIEKPNEFRMIKDELKRIIGNSYETLLLFEIMGGIQSHNFELVRKRYNELRGER